MLEVDKIWTGYRRNTGDLTWRLAVQGDAPAIERLCRISERLLGRTQKRPDLFASPVLLALVAEDRTGKVVDLLYVEAQVELIKMGLTGSALDEGTGLEEDLRVWLKGRGFNKALITTATNLKERMAERLKRAGFACRDGILSYWIRLF